MATSELTRKTDLLPSFLNDFFKPWNSWPNDGFGIALSPAVNITESEKEFKISVAAPGMNKTDFKIDLEGDVLTISAEKEENEEQRDERYNRKEYNYSSFSRSFTVPGDVLKNSIQAKYEDGVLQLMLPKKETTRLPVTKITVN